MDESLLCDAAKLPATAVAFDMDGLMFDTESVYWKAAEAQLGRRGYKYTQEICDRIMGRTPEYTFRLFIELFNLPEDWRTLQCESEELFLEFLKEGYDSTPGLMELFDELDRRGIPRCVCTSSASRVAREVLKKDGIIDRLDFIVTSDDITRGKPDPEGYQTASRKFGATGARMLVLEDSAAGLASARAGGFPCCMLRASHNRSVDFSGATAVVERLDDPAVFALLRAPGA